MKAFTFTDDHGTTWTTIVGPGGDRVASTSPERARGMARRLWAQGAEPTPAVAAPAPPSEAKGDTCPRCGSLEFAQVSSCKRRCRGCGFEDGGCA